MALERRGGPRCGEVGDDGLDRLAPACRAMRDGGVEKGLGLPRNLHRHAGIGGLAKRRLLASGGFVVSCHGGFVATSCRTSNEKFPNELL